MGALDKLPPDQRAVLQMVLQRGHSYDQIARLLSIDRAAVRQRALDGFDALTPTTVVAGPERALVTDYLLGQLPEKVSEQVHAYLQTSAADRQWANAIAAEVAALSPEPLPEIPIGAPLGAEHRLDGGLEPPSDPSAGAVGVAPKTSAAPREPEAQPPSAIPSHHSSRRGGAILLGIVGALIVAGILVAVLSTGGSTPRKKDAGTGNPTTPASSTTGTTTHTTTTTAGTTTPQILAQLNLASPTGASATVGVAQVIREDRVVGVVIDAQGVPANTSHNAYAVWLYNSPSSHSFVGFVRNLVGKNGKLAAEGRLPAGAAKYHRLLITLETQSKPVSPGEVLLSGPFREHP
jgi:hypothetical protein